MAGLKDQVNIDGTKYADYGDNANFYNNAFNWEPKRKNEFVMFVDELPAFLIKTSDKPKISNNEIALDHINIKRYVKGKSEWNTIAITLYDPILPSAAQMVMDWVRKHHESVTGRDGYSNFYKKEIKLHQLSPLGEIVEEWILKGAFITEAGFGGYDWSADEVQMIDITLRYDWAFLNF